MGRPSPRTQGCEEFDEDGNCIKPFQKFGTQQLKFVGDEPPKLSTTYQGVKQVDVGKSWKGITTSGYSGTKTTLFSERFQKGITGATPTSMREEAIQRQKEKLKEMGLPEVKIPTWEELFPPEPIDKHGCECENCKNGIGQCSDKCSKCNTWDLGCEALCGVTGVITDPISNWWDKYGIWVYVILGLVGLGILLWLLRPLFSMIGAFKGGAV